MRKKDTIDLSHLEPIFSSCQSTGLAFDQTYSFLPPSIRGQVLTGANTKTDKLVVTFYQEIYYPQIYFCHFQMPLTDLANHIHLLGHKLDNPVGDSPKGTPSLPLYTKTISQDLTYKKDT